MKRGLGLFLVLCLAATLGAGCGQQLKAENEQLKAAAESMTTQMTDLQAKLQEATQAVATCSQQRDACQAELSTLKAAAPATEGGSTAPAK